MTSKSDSELIDYLNTCDEETLLTLVKMMRPRLFRIPISFSLKVREWKVYKNPQDIPTKLSDKRSLLSEEIVYQLRYYGSNNFAYLPRKIVGDEPGVHYIKVLRDVLKTLNRITLIDILKAMNWKKPKDVLKTLNWKKLKVDIPRVATVPEYELLLCGVLLKIELKNKTEQEIIQMLEESGLEEDEIKRFIKEFSIWAAGGGTIIKLVKVLGKKTFTRIISVFIEQIIAIVLGKKTAKMMVKELVKKVPQKIFVKVANIVGLILIAWDIAALSYPAKRITVPCVSLIASVRTMERMEES